MPTPPECYYWPAQQTQPPKSNSHKHDANQTTPTDGNFKKVFNRSNLRTKHSGTRNFFDVVVRTRRTDLPVGKFTKNVTSLSSSSSSKSPGLCESLLVSQLDMGKWIKTFFRPKTQPLAKSKQIVQ
jgi:hypothetical protein